jgi:hypothetical protein
MAARSPARMSLEPAFCKQSKVLLLHAVFAHEATPPTKFVQSLSRRAALKVEALAAIPDSNIYAGFR